MKIIQKKPIITSASMKPMDHGMIEVLINLKEKSTELFCTAYQGETVTFEFQLYGLDDEDLTNFGRVEVTAPEHYTFSKCMKFQSLCKDQWIFLYVPFDVLDTGSVENIVYVEA